MKKAFLASLLFFTSSLAMAQNISCLDKLLPYNRNSGLHQLEKEEWNDGKDMLDVDGALAALTSLIGSKLMCKPTDVKVVISPVCNQMVVDVPQSNVCFLFTNLGYFFISKDKAKNVNFIFSKDKKFAEPESH